MDFEAIIGRECPTPIQWNTERRYLVGRVNDEMQKRDARIAALEATERELREAVKVLAKELYGKALDRAVGDLWGSEINDAVWNNPIAAAAVREAGNG